MMKGESIIIPIYIDFSTRSLRTPQSTILYTANLHLSPTLYMHPRSTPLLPSSNYYMPSLYVHHKSTLTSLLDPSLLHDLYTANLHLPPYVVYASSQHTTVSPNTTSSTYPPRHRTHAGKIQPHKFHHHLHSIQTYLPHIHVQNPSSNYADFLFDLYASLHRHKVSPYNISNGNP